MQNFSNPTEINNLYWLRQTINDGIPADCRPIFYRLKNELIAYHKGLIDHIIKNNGGEIKTPMETDYLEKYLAGFKFEFIPFFHSFGADGFMDFNIELGRVSIFYNTNCPPCRQRFTKIHELFHFLQLLDMQFLDFFDRIYAESDLPEFVIKQLLEKSTEKATAMYLMPNDYFRKKYNEIKNIDELTRIFGVSKKSLCIRIQECGLLYAQ